MAKTKKAAETDEAIKRTRLDIILSQAIEDDFIAEITAASPNIKYTQVVGVAGRGYSVPKLGDPIWPQLNSFFVLYCTDEETAQILDVVQHLRKEYIGEGLSCFMSEGTEI